MYATDGLREQASSRTAPIGVVALFAEAEEGSLKPLGRLRAVKRDEPVTELVSTIS
jgi:hypothetical protein